VAQIAEDLGMSDSCLRNWMVQAGIDEGRREGLSSRERDELVDLRREARVPDSSETSSPSRN
jgi:transposase-like protein